MESLGTTQHCSPRERARERERDRDRDRDRERESERESERERGRGREGGRDTVDGQIDILCVFLFTTLVPLNLCLNS